MRDSHSLQIILKIIKRFQEFSSLKINVEKCEACWLGKARHQLLSQLDVSKWTTLSKSCIKILGITVSYNKALAEKENFYTLSLDCRTLLNIWRQRWLSLAGKIQVFKSLVASKPVYLATMIDLQQNFCDTTKSLHKEFIWSGKRPKIGHSTLLGDYREGGLKDIGQMFRTNVTVEQTTLAKTSVGIETDKKLVPLESVTTKIIYQLFITQMQNSGHSNSCG